MNTENDYPLYQKDQVVKIVNSVVEKLGRSQDESTKAVYQQLRELKEIIDTARQDLSEKNPSEITQDHIPAATDELDEIVKATAEATGTIMDSCEAIEEKAGPDNQAVIDEVTKIYEACSFQDITGQRITRVVKTLQAIEGKVNALLGVIDDGAVKAKAASAESSASKDISEMSDEDLLNGPQSSDQAISQDEIDRLLKDLD